jgi:hypothetical protein
VRGHPQPSCKISCRHNLGTVHFRPSGRPHDWLFGRVVGLHPITNTRVASAPPTLFLVKQQWALPLIELDLPITKFRWHVGVRHMQEACNCRKYMQHLSSERVARPWSRVSACGRCTKQRDDARASYWYIESSFNPPSCWLVLQLVLQNRAQAPY